MFKRRYYAWCWRGREDISQDHDYLIQLGSMWEIWNRKPQETGPGRGVSVGYVQVFENESAAKTAYEGQKTEIYYDGGTVTLLFVKAYTTKGAAESAMSGNGEIIARYQQDREAARLLSQERHKIKAIAHRDAYYSVLSTLESRYPQFKKYEMSLIEDPMYEGFSLESKIDGYAACGAATEAEIIDLMKEQGIRYYRIKPASAEEPVNSAT